MTFSVGTVRRGVPHEDHRSAIYEVLIWDSLKFYATVLTPDESAT